MGILLPLDHTADMRWRIEGESLADLLITLARGIAGEIADGIAGLPAGPFHTLYKGEPAERLIRFANDLLYRLQVERELILPEAVSTPPGGWEVDGVKRAVERITGEIKAATYNDVLLKEEEGRWTAEITFDR